MEYSITIHPLIPVRIEADERSEMVTQLLFGEVFVVLEKSAKWYKIKNHTDGYEGWIDSKMNFQIPETLYKDFISTDSPFYISSPFAKVNDISCPYSTLLPGGSFLPHYNENEKTFRMGERFYVLLEGEVCEPLKNPVSPALIAERFLDIPYLWGGKSAFGIDCSGFVQILLLCAGIFLPRDAKDQYKEGVEVSYPDILPNDIAFFGDRKDKITHVGIILEDRRIIHASGKVKIDLLKEEGIFSEETREVTHYLQGIKRMV
ncbi:MAG: C40 family peptidase [Candidatus Azobacteroides sp.]|nr:C40 family peptidase [Candidatus Azobacteroides sp.]